MLLLEMFPFNVMELISLPGLTKPKTTSLSGTVQFNRWALHVPNG